jgi:hypothetical protein
MDNSASFFFKKKHIINQTKICIKYYVYFPLAKTHVLKICKNTYNQHCFQSIKDTIGLFSIDLEMDRSSDFEYEKKKLLNKTALNSVLYFFLYEK